MGRQGSRGRQACAGRKAAGSRRQGHRQADQAARQEEGADLGRLHGHLPPAVDQGAGPRAVGRNRHAALCARRVHLFQRRPQEHAQHPGARRRRAARHRRLSDGFDALRHRQGAEARDGDGRARQKIQDGQLFLDPRRFRRFRAVLLPVDADGRPATDGVPRRQGFYRGASPFNAGLYDHHRVELHNQNHTEATVFRFPGTHSTGCRSRLSRAPQMVRRIRCSRWRIR